MSIEGEGRRAEVVEPGAREVVATLALAMAGVLATRLPFARTGPMETDEWQFLANMKATWFPIHHTLFQTAAKALGLALGDSYRGLIGLDMVVSALALGSVWWWLRALVRPSTAAAATVVLAFSPLFWSMGEMAANYTMIAAVGSFLLGVAYRGWQTPKAWHPYASAVVLAVGTGYREDIGTFWLPVLAVILWRHRWRPALLSLAIFTAINLAWLLPMLASVGGLAEYRRQSAEFAHSAGFRNSIWYLGVVDAPVRYAVKIGLAMACLLGPGLVFLPRGLARVVPVRDGGKLLGLLALSVVLPLASHLLVHFGVAGYSFHYLPAMMAALALGVSRFGVEPARDRAVPRLVGLATILAAAFLFYPAEFDRPGLRGSFDIAVGRYTRAGMRARLEARAPTAWRTANSVPNPAFPPRAN